jgi:predicted RNA binding protein YcfA (HicA-like mRNA interferase family)
LSSRLPRVTAAQVISVLETIGFFLTRQSGSHKIYKNAEDRRVTVPFHSGKILHPKTLKSIISDSGLTVDEFIDLL